MTGLEAFKDVLYILSAVSHNEIDTNCETIKTIEKSLNALEIIKEKSVDIYILNDLGTLDDYNKWVLQRYGTYYQLTQEEFELLKEVLE